MVLACLSFTQRLMYNLLDIINKLEKHRQLNSKEMLELLKSDDKEVIEYLRTKARDVTDQYYGKGVYIRGLIEISNICIRNCRYCGIRKDNKQVKRYRLNKSEILEVAKKGYDQGFRTLVLQGGEDPYYTDDVIEDIIQSILSIMPDVAITLSLGVRDYDSFLRLRKAGASRYLLRHETANDDHFSYLHPQDQKLSDRQEALSDIRSLNYAVGSGIMVGSPGQKLEYIVEDLEYLSKLKVDMIGIGPFIPHKDTEYKNHITGDLNLTLKLISIIRLMFPLSAIPSTTALNTIDPQGRILGIQHGANVVMPNLSPSKAKANYNLYDNKSSSGLESSEYIQQLDELLKSYGYRIDYSIGHPKSINRGEFDDQL